MRFIFVTPSYRGDFERCKLLCESTTRFLPSGVEHLLLVDRRDLSMFKPLQNRTVRVIEAESLLPWWIFRVPGLSGWRLNMTGFPVRNWIYQQLLKISAACAADAEVINFIDSDVTLTRSVDLDYFVQDGLIRLQRTDHESPTHRRWLEVARRTLDIPATAHISGNYIGNVITWRHDNAIKMIDRIERVSGCSWQKTLAKKSTFSEYMLYGTFVENILGIEKAECFLDDRPNLHLCWNYDFKTDDGIRAFFDDTPHDSFGIMIHSKYGIPVSSYRHQVLKLWDRQEQK